MAQTMTRTRTQTALTKMATLLANINGELEFVRALLEAVTAHRDALTAREATLQQKREDVMAIPPVDSSIDPEGVGTAEGWKKSHPRKILLRHPHAYPDLQSPIAKKAA